jgi:hypothetical protein
MKCLSLMALRILYVTLKTVEIYNRWGIGFETQNYNNQTNAWILEVEPQLINHLLSQQNLFLYFEIHFR